MGTKTAEVSRQIQRGPNPSSALAWRTRDQGMPLLNETETFRQAITQTGGHAHSMDSMRITMLTELEDLLELAYLEGQIDSQTAELAYSWRTGDSPIPPPNAELMWDFMWY